MFARRIQKRKTASGELTRPQGRFVLLGEAKLLSSDEAGALHIPEVNDGALHSHQDRHNADDGAEDLVHVAQADNGLGHLQQGRGGIGLLLRGIIQAGVLDGDPGVAGKGGHHGLRFVAVTAGGAVGQRDDAQRLHPDPQRRGQRRIVWIKSQSDSRQPERIVRLADDGHIREQGRGKRDGCVG